MEQETAGCAACGIPTDAHSLEQLLDCSDTISEFLEAFTERAFWDRLKAEMN